MNIFGLIGNLLGIGKNALENRAKLKQLKAEQEFAITSATTNATVDRIRSNTDSDNQIDLITAHNKKYTYKDEVVTYLFLTPVIVATVVPFIVALKSGSWSELNNLILESYNSLDALPEWYKWVLGAVVVDVLGFRSFMRKVFEKWFNKNKVI